MRLATEVPSVLAVGGHLKNTVALSVASQVFVSQHIGDMETPQALSAFERAIVKAARRANAEPLMIPISGRQRSNTVCPT